MSIREQIAALEELASLDGDLRRIDAELEKERGGLDGMRAEVRSLEARLGADRETLAEMEKTRSELVTELRQMGQQIDRSREKLARSRNERESNAAQREIEELRKLQRDREIDLERLNVASEQARKSIEETEQKRGEIAQSLEGSEGGIITNIASLEEARGGKAKEREDVVRRLPVVLYRRYETLRTRRPVAIAKTHDGTCLGCHMSLPPMMFQQMRRQEAFEQCPQCRRIIYYVPPAPPPDAEGEEPEARGKRAGGASARSTRP